MYRSGPRGRTDVRDCTDEFRVDYDTDGPSSSGARGRAPRPQESDKHRLAQRQKQIDFGKNTIGYERYTRAIPKHKRLRSDPQTPDISLQVSKRKFDAEVRTWRRQLHDWDIKEGEAAHVFTAGSAAGAPEGGPSSSAQHVGTNERGEDVGLPTASLPDSRKRPLLPQVNQDETSNKRQQTQKPGLGQASNSGTPGYGTAKARSTQPSSWAEQENQMEAAVKADLFQDWEDDILL